MDYFPDLRFDTTKPDGTPPQVDGRKPPAHPRLESQDLTRRWDTRGG